MLSLDPPQYLKGLPLDYYVNFSKVSTYFAKDYWKIERRNPKISDDVIARIEGYSRKINATSKILENVEKLKELPAIVTGQQPCLLTGPLYVMYKALTAIVLAERYNGVPVFWNASEDDDIQEINHIWVMNADLEKISVELEPKPFSEIALKSETLQCVLQQLETLTPPTEFREKFLTLIETCSLSFSEMFSQLLSKLFSDYGLVVVEPYIFADLAKPLYQKLIENPTKASEFVNNAGDSLESKGYKRQTYKMPESCSFYLILDKKRYNVTFDGNFRTDSSTFTKEELLALLEEHPDQFSSTVISRPLIQDYLFSTLAYCAGPGEITYFAQMKDIYTFFGVEEPYLVPRFGGTIIEKKVQKVLDKYNLEVFDLMNPEYIAKTLAKMDIQKFFTKEKTQILNSIKELEDYVTSVDPSLKKTGAAVKTQVVKQLEALEEKTAASLKAKNRIQEEQIVKASMNIFPHKILQERVLNIFQYLIRYPSFITSLYNHFQTAHPGQHLIIHPGD